MAGAPAAGGTSRGRRRHPIIVMTAIAWGVVLVAGGWYGLLALRMYNETARTTARFDPPVLAGQNVTGACSGGFYARKDQTIVILLSAHCSEPGRQLRDDAGRLLGVLGPRALTSECPAGRICAPSDFLTLALAPDRIPWGHLDQVDMGAGGYRSVPADSAGLSCAEIEEGAAVEVDGREHYRTGTVVSKGAYDFADDITFPCMLVADVEVAVGDSGGAVLVDGQPAGIISRQLGQYLGFTPLREGLENLGLTLCTTPDCGLTPETAVQPTD